jgi:Flp pilus assembly pilin Flp
MEHTTKIMGLKKMVTRFIAEEEGQSMMEYILILGVVLMAISKFKNSFGTIMGKLADGLGSKIEANSSE